VVASELTSQEGRARSQGTRDSDGAHLSTEVMSGAVGHMMAPDPTSAGRCDPKLQLTWQRVDAHTDPYLDLDLVCDSIPSSGYQHCSTSVFYPVHSNLLFTEMFMFKTIKFLHYLYALLK
jgi:hypothetical protein